jgi:hypothetical protein
VEDPVTTQTEEGTITGLRAGAVGAPATPGCSLPVNGRNGDTPIEALQTPVADQWLNSRYVIAATDTHAIIEEAFSMPSVPGLYNEDQLPLCESPETAVNRLGGWCEVAGSL